MAWLAFQEDFLFTTRLQGLCGSCFHFSQRVPFPCCAPQSTTSWIQLHAQGQKSRALENQQSLYMRLLRRSVYKGKWKAPEGSLITPSWISFMTEANTFCLFWPRLPRYCRRRKGCMCTRTASTMVTGAEHCNLSYPDTYSILSSHDQISKIPPIKQTSGKIETMQPESTWIFLLRNMSSVLSCRVGPPKAP